MKVFVFSEADVLARLGADEGEVRAVCHRVVQDEAAPPLVVAVYVVYSLCVDWRCRAWPRTLTPAGFEAGSRVNGWGCVKTFGTPPHGLPRRYRLMRVKLGVGVASGPGERLSYPISYRDGQGWSWRVCSTQQHIALLLAQRVVQDRKSETKPGAWWRECVMEKVRKAGFELEGRRVCSPVDDRMRR